MRVESIDLWRRSDDYGATSLAECERERSIKLNGMRLAINTDDQICRHSRQRGDRRVGRYARQEVRRHYAPRGGFAANTKSGRVSLKRFIYRQRIGLEYAFPATHACCIVKSNGAGYERVGQRAPVSDDHADVCHRCVRRAVKSSGSQAARSFWSLAFCVRKSHAKGRLALQYVG